MSLHLLRAEEILTYWPNISPHIDAALEHSAGEITTFQTFQQAMIGQIHVWAYVDQDKITSAFATRFLIFDNTKSLQIMACGGAVADWELTQPVHSAFEQFAKDNECQNIQIWGRKGWVKRLENVTSESGKKYEPLYHVISMEIDK
jgi:hypothetical protein